VAGRTLRQSRRLGSSFPIHRGLPSPIFNSSLFPYSLLRKNKLCGEKTRFALSSGDPVVVDVFGMLPSIAPKVLFNRSGALSPFCAAGITRGSAPLRERATLATSLHFSRSFVGHRSPELLEHLNYLSFGNLAVSKLVAHLVGQGGSFYTGFRRVRNPPKKKICLGVPTYSWLHQDGLFYFALPPPRDTAFILYRVLVPFIADTWAAVTPPPGCAFGRHRC